MTACGGERHGGTSLGKNLLFTKLKKLMSPARAPTRVPAGRVGERWGVVRCVGASRCQGREGRGVEVGCVGGWVGRGGRRRDEDDLGWNCQGLSALSGDINVPNEPI